MFLQRMKFEADEKLSPKTRRKQGKKRGVVDERDREKTCNKIQLKEISFVGR